MTVAVTHQHAPEGRAALLRAAAEARSASTTLQVLHVFSGSQDPRAEAAEREAVTVLVRDTLDGTATVEWELLSRRPGADTGATFVDLVEESGAELLVLGSRRRSAVGKLLLGSTVQRILLDVPVPILLVKAADDR